MSKSYLAIAHQGKNDWWRYFLSVFLILFAWIILGGVISAVVAIFIFISNGIPLVEIELQLMDLLQNPSLESFIIINLQFITFILGIFLAVKVLHQRKFLSLVSADGKIDFSRLVAGFAVWFVMQLSLIAVNIILNPSNFAFTFEPSQWFPLLFAALILTPIQTSAEELFFRGYVIQGLSLITKRRLILIILSSILFMLPHFLNPEMQRGAVWMALFYFGFGVFTAVITLKDNRLELALGVHAANNLSLLFVTSKDSVLPTKAIWTIQETGAVQGDLFVFILFCAIFFYIFFGKKFDENKMDTRKSGSGK